mmetsp:Transcript_34571/g.41777  ORF Transcript_34571/g.41777 Transcript_34571/m.41777 type:complete len:212 (+) Transcript_34571:286-921(+)
MGGLTPLSASRSVSWSGEDAGGGDMDSRGEDAFAESYKDTYVYSPTEETHVRDNVRHALAQEARSKAAAADVDELTTIAAAVRDSVTGEHHTQRGRLVRRITSTNSPTGSASSGHVGFRDEVPERPMSSQSSGSRDDDARVAIREDSRSSSRASSVKSSPDHHYDNHGPDRPGSASRRQAVKSAYGGASAKSMVRNMKASTLQRKEQGWQA